MIDIRSRAHRILQPMSHYYDLSKCSGWLGALDFRPALGASEAVLGLYSLDIGGFSDAIVFTTLGLYLRSGQSWSPISYTEIERASAPTSKEHVTGFSIRKRDDGEIWIPVAGSKDGRFYDAFEVLRFVHRAKTDALSA
jgi:hypothetical protein